MKTLNVVDMFCGSGGTSTGVCQAAMAMGLKVKLTAINSWPVAVETHAANHPGAQHICKNVMAVDPLKIGYRKNRLHILVASPECKWHSKARGNKPINDQLRISAWDVVRFTEELLPWVLVVENVQEFCFPTETAVLTKRGVIPIGDIVVGDEVWTHNARWKPVIAVRRKKSETVNVVGYANSISQSTPEHRYYSRQVVPMITKHGNDRSHKARFLEPDWTRADRLADRDNTSTYSREYSGYAWATPSVLPGCGKRMPKTLKVDVQSVDFFYMIGRWLGDGWIRRRRGKKSLVRICEERTKADLLEKMLRKTGMRWRRDRHTDTVDVFDLEQSSSTVLGPWLTRHFGKYSYGKTLPAWIYSASDEQKWALIEGYRDADGYVREDGVSSVGSASRCLSVAVKLLLQSLGVVADISKREACEQEHITDKEKVMQCRAAYQVCWKKEREWEKCHRNELHIWGRVREVIPSKEKVEVVDITVADDHSFVADGQVVHNCDWGPIDANGRPIKKHKGKIFDSWCENIRTFGYTLEKRILCSADYGDPTIRRRLFVIAYRKKKDTIHWPVPTHSKDGINGLKRWRSAGEIIDWSHPSRSIFDPERRKPLVFNTIKRIRVGVEKFYPEPYAKVFLDFIDRGLACRESGEAIQLPMPAMGLPEGFIIPQHSWDKYRSAADPAPTVTTTSRGIGIAQPIAVVPNRGEREGQEPRVHDLEDPAPTITTKKGHGIVQAFCTTQHGTTGSLASSARSVDDPTSTIVAGGVHHGVVEPLMVQFAHGEGTLRRVKQVTNPVSTLTTKGEWGVMQPVIIPPEGIHRGNQPRSPDDPMHTILASRGGGHVMQPMVAHSQHQGNDEHRIKPADHAPCPTITTKRGLGVVEPFLSLYYSSGGQTSDINKPTPTITCEDRISIIEPRADNMCVDILYRMFTNQELARAMGFPEDYIFKGTSTDQTKQIGNAVTVGKARSIAQAQIAHILDCI